MANSRTGPNGGGMRNTRSGREYGAYGGPSLLGTDAGTGKSGDFEVEADRLESFEVGNAPTAEKRDANGHWATREPSEASESEGSPDFAGGEGEKAEMLEQPGSQNFDFLNFARWLAENRVRERG